jgi:hypothetical protein
MVFVPCLAIGVLAAFLWGRSYLVADALFWRIEGREMNLRSENGLLALSLEGVRDAMNAWQYRQQEMRESRHSFGSARLNDFGFATSRSDRVSTIVAPHWFPMLIAAALAATSWITISGRFSIRRLWAVATLLAIDLFFIVLPFRIESW